ncbi:MAG: type II toxin-antitoxin system prevent-host-death family antitoxin [bacterium]|nr:type II toxin-antitoxin system prevent-host-death family antitoxin [bacterium]
MTNLMSISDVREQLPNLVSRVSKYMDRIVITVKGQPKATLVSAEELESLEETAEILSIPNIKKDLAKSRKQFKKGEFVYLSDLK